MAHIRAVTAVLDHHRRRPCPDGRRASAPGSAPRRPLRGPLARFSAISVTARLSPMLSTSSPVAEVGVGLAMLHVGAEAADAGDDRLAVFGMLADLARQRQQCRARDSRSTSSGGSALRQAGALGLLAVYGLAELDIGPEAAGAQRDFEAARRDPRRASCMPPSTACAIARPRTGACSGTRDNSCSR